MRESVMNFPPRQPERLTLPHTRGMACTGAAAIGGAAVNGRWDIAEGQQTALRDELVSLALTAKRASTRVAAIRVAVSMTGQDLERDKLALQAAVLERVQALEEAVANGGIRPPQATGIRLLDSGSVQGEAVPAL